jgi:hypothetical protein
MERNIIQLKFIPLWGENIVGLRCGPTPNSYSSYVFIKESYVEGAIFATPTYGIKVLKSKRDRAKIK